MGQKINPKSLRLGNIYTWDSKWFSDKKKYPRFLEQDILIKNFLNKKLRDAILQKIEIERSLGALTLTIYAAKPGIIIGRGGAGIEELKKELKSKVLNKKSIVDIGKASVNINIKEVSRPNFSAAVVMYGIIIDLEKRIPFRRAMKQALSKVEKGGAGGAKVAVSGRLNGAEIARREVLSFGKIPLHTLRADIDYAQGIAKTIYGTIGVKVWIYRGEIFGDKKEEKSKQKNNTI